MKKSTNKSSYILLSKIFYFINDTYIVAKVDYRGAAALKNI